MSKIAEGYKQTEVGVIPRDWEVKKLSDLSSMKSGETITSKSISEIETYPCFGGNGLRGYTAKHTHNGDFALIGRQGALCGNVQFVTDKFFASEHAVVVTPKTNTDIKWLYYMLIAMNLNQYSESSAQPGLSVSKILNLPIPLPPTKAEQTAIATALNDADALITQLEKLIAKKRNIKQGAMQKLLNPYDEKRMKNGELKMVNEKGNSQFTTRHLQLKKGWEVKKLGECLRQNPDYGVNAAAVTFNESLPVYLRITDITEEGRYSKKNIVSVSNINSLSYYLEKGDLVFARTGASVGKTYLYNTNDGKLVFAGFLIRIKTNSEILNPVYFQYYTQTSSYWNWIRANSMRTGQPGINGNEYKELVLIIPSIETQNRIAQILSDMDAEIEALEKKLDKYRMLKQGMMQNLLTGRVRLI